MLSQYDFKDTRDDHITMRSQCCHSMMSQVHELTRHHEVTVLSQYDVDNNVTEHTTWSYHSEDTVLSQVFAHTVRSL